MSVNSVCLLSFIGDFENIWPVTVYCLGWGEMCYCCWHGFLFSFSVGLLFVFVFLFVFSFLLFMGRGFGFIIVGFVDVFFLFSFFFLVGLLFVSFF